MPDLRALAATLRALDGRGYKAYKDIAGEYDAGTFRLLIDHVQGDPFAEASRLRAVVPRHAQPAGMGLRRRRPAHGCTPTS
jgi:predicted ABC-class ATPase